MIKKSIFEQVLGLENKKTQQEVQQKNQPSATNEYAPHTQHQYPNVKNAVINSKDINIKGAAFFGLQGAKSNGGEFLQDALKNGCAIAIVEPEYANQYLESHTRTGSTNNKQPVVAHPNPIDVLKNIAIAKRLDSTKTKFIGITGSMGKTTTKEMLGHMLPNSYASFGNYNNNIGLPLSICNMPLDTQYGIFELGMSNPKEIAYLREILQPDVCVVTCIAPCHLEFMKSIENIAHEKASIYHQHNAKCVVPADSAYLNILIQHAKEYASSVLLFGNSNSRHSFGSGIDAFNNKPHINRLTYNAEIAKHGTLVNVLLNGNHYSYTLKTLGNAFVYNSIAAIAAISIMNSETADLQIEAQYLHKLENFQPMQGRGRIYNIAHNGSMLLDETYNSNPYALKESINRLKEHAAYHKQSMIAVVGDMKELGECSLKYHIDALQYCVEAGCRVYCCGSYMMKAAEEVKGVQYFNDACAIVQSLEKEHNCAILIKGSRSMRMEKIVESLLLSS